jgi:hypothetical protein
LKLHVFEMHVTETKTDRACIISRVLVVQECEFSCREWILLMLNLPFAICDWEPACIEKVYGDV